MTGEQREKLRLLVNEARRRELQPKPRARKVELSRPVFPWRDHGTVYAYAHFRCRCDECQAAKRSYKGRRAA